MKNKGVIRLTPSQEEEDKADQSTKVLLRPPQKVAPFWLRVLGFAGPGSKMHHLEHLWHTIQVFSVYLLARLEGGDQVLWKDQLIEPRICRLWNVSVFTQTRLLNICKVLILIVHD